MRIKPVSPADALEMAGEPPFNYAVQAINDVICAMIAENPNRAWVGFTVSFDVIEAAVRKAYEKYDYTPVEYGREWERFPAIFSEYWDIEEHWKKDGRASTIEYYSFRPKGCKIVKDNGS